MEKTMKKKLPDTITRPEFYAETQLIRSDLKDEIRALRETHGAAIAKLRGRG
jgi:hypothetical protein